MIKSNYPSFWILGIRICKQKKLNRKSHLRHLWGMRYCFSQQGVIVWEHKGDNGMALLVVFQLGLTIVREFIWILSKVSSSNNTAETTDSITDDLIKNTDNMFFGFFCYRKYAKQFLKELFLIVYNIL